MGGFVLFFVCNRILPNCGRTILMNWTDSRAIANVFSISAAVFGAVCNVLCWGLSNYQSFYLQHYRLIWSPSFMVAECLCLAPLLALFILRRYAPVAFLYAVALLSILKVQIDQLIQYRNLGDVALAHKMDTPGVLLLLAGAISIVAVLVWAAIRCAVIIR